MPTLIELQSLPETIKLCAELGLQFIELNMNMPQYQLDTLNTSTLCGYKDSSVYFTTHVDENLNIWDFNPLVSKAYLDTVLSTIAFAIDTNVPILNLHMNNGVYFTLPNRKIYLFERYREEYIKKTIRFRQECERAIGENNLKICIENCDGFTDFQHEAIKYLLQSRVFGLTMDIGHNHSSNNRDEPFIMRHMDKLHHMNIHDAVSTRIILL